MLYYLKCNLYNVDSMEDLYLYMELSNKIIYKKKLATRENNRSLLSPWAVFPWWPQPDNHNMLDLLTLVTHRDIKKGLTT